MKTQIYANGLIACSVCAPKEVTPAEVAADVNSQNPTGINNKWVITRDGFADGGKNPHVCEKDKNRLHYLLHC